MTDDERGVLLSDGRSSIFLYPPTTYPDGHGYHHRVDLVAGPCRGTIDAKSYAPIGALRQFRDELIALHRSLTGAAQLSVAYENLKMILKGDGLGHMLIEVQAEAGDLMDIRLSFTLTSDQTKLPAVIAGIERFIA